MLLLLHLTACSSHHIRLDLDSWVRTNLCYTLNPDDSISQANWYFSHHISGWLWLQMWLQHMSLLFLYLDLCVCFFAFLKSLKRSTIIEARMDDRSNTKRGTRSQGASIVSKAEACECNEDRLRPRVMPTPKIQFFQTIQETTNVLILMFHNISLVDKVAFCNKPA